MNDFTPLHCTPKANHSERFYRFGSLFGLLFVHVETLQHIDADINLMLALDLATHCHLLAEDCEFWWTSVAHNKMGPVFTAVTTYISPIGMNGLRPAPEGGVAATKPCETDRKINRQWAVVSWVFLSVCTFSFTPILSIYHTFIGW